MLNMGQGTGDSFLALLVTFTINMAQISHQQWMTVTTVSGCFPAPPKPNPRASHMAGKTGRNLEQDRRNGQ